MACPMCGGRAVVAPTANTSPLSGTVIRLVYMWLICRINKRLVEKATELSKGLRAVLVKRGIPLREWVELGGARERQRRAD